MDTSLGWEVLNINKEKLEVEKWMMQYIETEKEFKRIRFLVYNMVFSIMAASILLLLYQMYSFVKEATIEYAFFYLMLTITFAFVSITFSFVVLKRYIRVRDKFNELKEQLSDSPLYKDYKKMKGI